jgi:hypothetical protein
MLGDGQPADHSTYGGRTRAQRGPPFGSVIGAGRAGTTWQLGGFDTDAHVPILTGPVPARHRVTARIPGLVSAKVTAED